MSEAQFKNAALVVLGHGTALNAESAAPVYQHAAELRRRGIFAQVREAFWKQEPRLEAVLGSVTAPRVFLVPLFISEGYFSEEVIPRALGFRGEGAGDWSRVQRKGAQTCCYCHVVGTHESMTGVLLARAKKVVEQFPFPRPPKPADITLIIAGHGTGQNANSREAVERQVEAIRRLNLYAAVQAVYLEEEPRIPESYRLAQTKNIVVVPFFISDGLHVREDIPVLLGEAEPVMRQRLAQGQPTWRNPTEKQGKRVWYAPSVGSEPGLAEVILERVREASQW